MEFFYNFEKGKIMERDDMLKNLGKKWLEENSTRIHEILPMDTINILYPVDNSKSPKCPKCGKQDAWTSFGSDRTCYECREAIVVCTNCNEKILMYEKEKDFYYGAKEYCENCFNKVVNLEHAVRYIKKRKDLKGKIYYQVSIFSKCEYENLNIKEDKFIFLKDLKEKII